MGALESVKQKVFLDIGLLADFPSGFSLGPQVQEEVSLAQAGGSSVDFLHQKAEVDSGSSGRRKKPKQVIKKVENSVMLVIGEDIKMNDVILTHSHTLVGRFGRRKFSPVGVKNWVSATW